MTQVGESTILRIPGYRDVVMRRYEKMYFEFNQMYNRKPEAITMMMKKSPYFVKVYEAGRAYMILERLDIPLGDWQHIGKENMEDILKHTTKEKFIEWLKGLKEELKRMQVWHRDVHPGNIMYSIKQKTFKLIDFTWALMDGEPNLGHPDVLNIHYGRDDNEAIDKMIKEIEEWNVLKKK